MREEVAGMVGMHHDIGFRNGAAKGAATVAEGLILKILRVPSSPPLRDFFGAC
jgi:hypothetical protein